MVTCFLRWTPLPLCLTCQLSDLRKPLQGAMIAFPGQHYLSG
jgi:hypothetical protein